MLADPNDPVSHVASLIMRYLECNPQASDGYAGIREFWLGGYPMPRGSHVLDAALDRLTDSGVLTRIDLPGSGATFRLSRN